MFPAASVAVHVTVVVPIGNVEPEAGSQVGPVVTATSSVAVASNVIANPDWLVEEDEMLDGMVMVGADTSVNVTVTVNVAEPVFPSPSVALHVTVVVPTEKLLPDVVVHVGPLVTSLSSLAETEYVMVGVPVGVSVETVMSEGTVTVGSVLSDSAIVIEPVSDGFSLS